MINLEETVAKYFKSGANKAYESVHDVVIRCIKSSSKIYGEGEAKAWADGISVGPKETK